MSVSIPYVRELAFEYGKYDIVTEQIRRVIAHNPSGFTHYGTGTYIVGCGECAVIDPGPRDADHIAAILNATRGERITHILITHTHNDHSPGTALLLDHCDARTYGFGPHGTGVSDGVVVEEGGDMDFEPDIRVADGDRITGAEWEIECVYTPGHTSNHMCYALADERALFTGDHVMGWSTSVIAPPDGNMADYMASLRKLLAREDQIYWPTHGPPITEPRLHVQAFIAHREEREQQILACVRNGTEQITDMVPLMYQGTDKRLYPAAAQSVYASVLFMLERGSIACTGKPTLETSYRLA